MIDEKKLKKELREKICPEKFGERCNSLEVIYAILQLIDEQLKVGEWIPCSERLPEKSGDCQVTIKDGEYYVCPFYLYFDGQYWKYSGNDFICHYKILAWRYVPEPWEGE